MKYYRSLLLTADLHSSEMTFVVNHLTNIRS